MYLFKNCLSYCCRYASARIEKLQNEGRIKRHSRLSKWTAITITELMGFLSIIINMGIISAPGIEDYWKTSWIAEIPFFPRLMSRDRFELIFWMLHASHSTGVSPKRLDKIGMLLDMLLAKFRATYTPHQNLAVDETMLRFRGRFVGKQYMPKKPVKWGIKSFTLADSHNGYVLNILPYTGVETLDVASPDYATLPQPARVVMHLMEPYLHKQHHVFTDRYYSSIPLAQSLHANGTAFTGTAVKDRTNLPDPIRAGETPSVGQVMAFRSTNNLLALSWRAKKGKAPVVVVSTACSAEMVTVSNTEKPSAVNIYNHNMNGVDIADQYCISYPFTRKTLKWWRKVFFWLLDLCVTNSYALYREQEQSPKPKPHLTYRRMIVEALASRYMSTAPPRRQVGRPRKRCHPESGTLERLSGKLHLLGKREQRRCVVCGVSGSGERHRSIYYCKTCPDNPTLCPVGCFERYHTLRDYTV